jgi:hypothetical protein
MKETYELFSKVYAPAPAKPPYFDKEVTRIGGRNPYLQPILKVGWGMDLRTFRNDDPNAIKYPGPRGIGLDRWVLEAWKPIEFWGTPIQWEANRYFTDNTGKRIDALGEYPSRGMYVMSHIFFGIDMGFLPCDEGALQFIEQRHQEFLNKPLNAYTTIEAYKKLQENMAREQEASLAQREKEADEWGDYCATHAEEINRNPVFSFPKDKLIVTPDEYAREVRGH